MRSKEPQDDPPRLAIGCLNDGLRNLVRAFRGQATAIPLPGSQAILIEFGDRAAHQYIGHRDIIAFQFQPQRARQARDKGFAGAIGSGIGRVDASDHRRNNQNMPAATRPHRRHTGAHAMDNAVNIGAQHRLNIVPFGVDQPAMVTKSRVGKQHIQASKSLGRERDCRRKLFSLGDIAHGRQEGAARLRQRIDFVLQCLEAFSAAGESTDIVSRARESDGSRSPDPA